MMLTFISYNTPTIKLKGSLMRLEKVFIKKFRSFENVSLVLSKNDFPDVFSIASKNGGGKSTLLQFIFIMLSSFKDEGKKEFLKNLFYGNNINKKKDDSIATFNISHNDNEYTLEFLYTKNKKTTELVNLDIFLD
jgi:predicted ATP-binding protein involved in virulence